MEGMKCPHCDGEILVLCLTGVQVFKPGVPLEEQASPEFLDSIDEEEKAQLRRYLRC